MKNTVLMIFIMKMAYSQEPPTLAMPTDENKILIDSLVKTSMLKTYFVKHASDKIYYQGWKKEWSDKQIAERENKISFEKFSEETFIYNAFAEFAKKELETLIAFSIKMNQGLQEPKILFTVPMLEQNIDVFIEEEYLNWRVHLWMDH